VYVVYLREAHALDSAWPMHEAGLPPIEEPRTFAERRAAASACMQKLDLAPIPCLIDGLDNAVGEAYEAWPDRLYVIDSAGRVAFRGGPGPFGFDVDAAEAALKAELSASP
jgi:hypothetical protein